MVVGLKNFKLLPDISFDSSFQKIVLSSLLLFLCACFSNDLDDNQWNEVATWAARNINNTEQLYLIVSNVVNLCPNIWFIRNYIIFWKKEPQKKQVFPFFKKLLFHNEWSYWYQWKVALRDFSGLSKKCSFEAFPKI